MAQITIIFDEEADTHSLIIDKCSGLQLLIAYQSLENKIEEDIDMPLEIALLLASKAQAQEAKDVQD